MIEILNSQLPGVMGGQPAPIQILTDADYATVTTANFLTLDQLEYSNSSQIKQINITELNWAWVAYNYDSAAQTATFGIFNLSISGGILTLSPWISEGSVELPVVDGDFATFNGTTGRIEDAGFKPSDATKTNVVMATTPSTVGHAVKFADADGTIAGIGAAINSGITTAYGGGGTTNTFTATGLVTGSVVTATIRASTNSVSITKALPGANTLAITFSADPGAGTIVQWIALSAAI